MMRNILASIICLGFVAPMTGAKGFRTRKTQDTSTTEEPRCGGQDGCWYSFTWDTEHSYEGDLQFKTTSGEFICDGWGGCSKLMCGEPCSETFVLYNNHTVTPSRITRFGFLIMTHDYQFHAQFGGHCDISNSTFSPIVAAQESVYMALEDSSLGSAYHSSANMTLYC